MPVPFSGEYGEITSPNYPHKYPDDLVIHYTISVPRGRISLTLTELHLSPPPRYSYPGDHLEVYGFGGVRNEALRVFDNSSKTNSLTFVSISNFLEVRFVSSSRFSKIRLPMARFKAVYTVLETGKLFEITCRKDMNYLHACALVRVCSGVRACGCMCFRVGVCACLYAYLNVNVSVCVCWYMFVLVHVFARMFVYVCARTRVPLCTSIRVCLSMSISVSVGVHGLVRARVQLRK